LQQNHVTKRLTINQIKFERQLKIYIYSSDHQIIKNLFNAQFLQESNNAKCVIFLSINFENDININRS